VRAFNANGNSAFSNEASVSTPGSGGTSNSSNLALNQPVTASSTDTNKPEANAVDGDAKTYWRSGNVSGSNPIAWLRADLGAAMTVGRVVIRWKENYYGKTYEIQVSNNEVDWTPVYSATGNSGVQDFSFTPAMAQYVRIYLTKNNKSNYRILEFEVYASGSGSVAKSGGGEDEEAIAATVVPDEFVLEQNYPNPFNPSTQIQFGLPQASHVTIKVYNINGAEVEKLVDGQYPGGKHAITFHAENLSSGTYFYVMQAGEVRQVRRLMLVK
jgi:hypothetical protein